MGGTRKYKKNFLTKMLILKDEIVASRNKEEAQDYIELKNFTNSCCYFNYKHSVKLVNSYLSGKPTEDIAVMLGITASVCRDHLKEASDNLYKIFGDDFFELFSDYSSNKQEIKNRIHYASFMVKGSSQFIFPDVIASIPVSKTSTRRMFTVYECREELEFLLRYSRPVMQEALSSLNTEKLNFILRVMDGEDGTQDERFNIIKILGTKEEEIGGEFSIL